MDSVNASVYESPERPRSLESINRPMMEESELPEKGILSDRDDSCPSSPSSIVPNLTRLDSEAHVVAFTADDKDHPFNWPVWKKLYVMNVIIVTVMNSTMGSSLASNIGTYIAKEWNITNENLLILPTSMYLVGYVLGPLLWGPLSETYGRKPITLGAFWMFLLFMMASALAPNFAALVIFRLLCGIGAACAITVSGGICADLFQGHQARGRAMAFFMGVTTFGPTIGPVVSGYISPISWRWSFWVGLIFAGVTAALLFTISESYVPIILKQRAKRLRKETGNPAWRAPMELEEQNISHIITVVLTRPVRMFCTEAIIFFSCIYLSFAYAIFYMFFQAFPIIYQGVYGFNAGEEGLAFLPIGIGACLACVIYIIYDGILRRAQAQNKAWVRKEESRRLPLACFGGPFIVVAAFWIGWTARADIHWICPVIAGIPFGIGFLLLFMSLLNYIVDAYKLFAASAMAAAGTCRSIWGCVLPFAAKSLYDTLGIAWACSLIGFLALLLAFIPFVFYWKGESLRARSKFCQYLVNKEREEEEKQRGKAERRALREAQTA
ncbi:MFS general substrate transporter [Microthyrium microscopicum]|uniref:MFS general substrate transporter n=1 Tax=Microthyrium microscopicum TaxID=703497 RepID=A0A6A6U2Y1_9PEZI|nr:MFS general substrate transporter [Microthyrium microscopicum]